MSFNFDVGPDLDEMSGLSEGFIEYEEADFEEDFSLLGIDPGTPTPAKPGSEEKVIMLAARYAAGLPLWHEADCYDHGPKQVKDLLEADFDDE